MERCKSQVNRDDSYSQSTTIMRTSRCNVCVCAWMKRKNDNYAHVHLKLRFIRTLIVLWNYLLNFEIPHDGGFLWILVVTICSKRTIDIEAYINRITFFISFHLFDVWHPKLSPIKHNLRWKFFFVPERTYCHLQISQNGSSIFQFSWLLTMNFQFCHKLPISPIHLIIMFIAGIGLHSILNVFYCFKHF